MWIHVSDVCLGWIDVSTQDEVWSSQTRYDELYCVPARDPSNLDDERGGQVEVRNRSCWWKQENITGAPDEIWHYVSPIWESPEKDATPNKYETKHILQFGTTPLERTEGGGQKRGITIVLSIREKRARRVFRHDVWCNDVLVSEHKKEDSHVSHPSWSAIGRSDVVDEGPHVCGYYVLTAETIVAVRDFELQEWSGCRFLRRQNKGRYDYQWLEGMGSRRSSEVKSSIWLFA